MLPFGLKTTPRIFPKVVLLLARSWRADGIRVLLYMEDWLILVGPQEVPQIREKDYCILPRSACGNQLVEKFPRRGHLPYTLGSERRPTT